MSEVIERWLAQWLRRRGWIVFWLEHEARYCSAYNKSFGDRVCWLNEFNKTQRKKSIVEAAQ